MINSLLNRVEVEETVLFSFSNHLCIALLRTGLAKKPI